MNIKHDSNRENSNQDQTVRPILLVYSECFSPLSETFVYRLAVGVKRLSVTVMTHERLNQTEFPDAHLRVKVIGRKHTGILRRTWTLVDNSVRYGLAWPETVSIGRGDQKPDVIFAHFGTCGLRALPVAIENAIPLVTMFHGCDIGSWVGFRRYRKCLPTLFRKGAAFVVATEFMRDKVEKLGCPQEKIHKIGLPIPRLRDIDDFRAKRKTSSPVRFLHVGRLHSQKGVLYTIRAFSRAAKLLSAAELVIVGEGPERFEAQKLVLELALDDRVEFKGALSFSDVKRELADADIYVIHSVTTSDGDTEGFGVSLAEASEAALPVIATRHNGFPEVIQDERSGILIPEKDVDAMADAMVRLAKDANLRRKMGSAGRAHVRARFDPDIINRQYEKLFLSLAQKY